ncbi:MAG: 4Fe-4S dicluster domain-containing protein [Lysobacteraceae bacterium]
MGKPLPLKVVDDGAMYVSEAKVYPREVSGRFQRFRHLAVVVLLGLYYGVAWIDIGGQQAVLWDLPARKFHVFGLVFWPQDFIFLALLLVMAGLSLFFFTALAGRLWCGYACPQTVWTEVFLWMERWTAGDRAKRMKLDAGPWTGGKLLRKGSKHLLWAAFALWTGFTFVGYFTPIRELGARLVPFEWGGYETFWTLFYAVATWGNAGFLREQVCKYMCPYARFQSAMFDRNTLIISYDERRGEPRGPRRKGSLASVLERARGLIAKDDADGWVAWFARHRSAADLAAGARGTTSVVDAAIRVDEREKPVGEALGDCIDCTMCVQVCPTGIDIRNGLQYECIACGACIDACDEVMGKIGYPSGLVRYTSQNAVDGRPTKVLRARVLVYATLLGAIAFAIAVGILTRSPLIVDVLRDRNALYRTAADGAIENGYTLRLINKSEAPARLRIRLDEAPDGVAVADDPGLLTLGPGEVRSVGLSLRAPAGSVKGRRDVSIVVESDDGVLRVEEETRFFGPF